MERFNRIPQLIRHQVRVELSGREVRVSEEKLQAPEIHASLKEMSRKRVAERVGGNFP